MFESDNQKVIWLASDSIARMCQQRNDEWLVSAVRREFVLRVGHSLWDFALFLFRILLILRLFSTLHNLSFEWIFFYSAQIDVGHKFHTFIGWLVFNTFHNSHEISFPDWTNAFFPSSDREKKLDFELRADEFVYSWHIGEIEKEAENTNRSIH